MDSVDNVDCFYVVHESFDFSRVVELCRKKEIHNFYVQSINIKIVDNVDNYLEIRSSPINTTSPAPIVINMSSFIHFSKINFSISSNDGK